MAASFGGALADVTGTTGSAGSVHDANARRATAATNGVYRRGEKRSNHERRSAIDLAADVETTPQVLEGRDTIENAGVIDPLDVNELRHRGIVDVDQALQVRVGEKVR